MCHHKKKLFIAASGVSMPFLTAQLLGESCWFEITPLPDGEWEIAVKEDLKDEVLTGLNGVEPYIYH